MIFFFFCPHERKYAHVRNVYGIARYSVPLITGIETSSAAGPKVVLPIMM